MKFVVAVVVLGLVLGAKSSGLLPYPYYASPLSYTAVSGPALVHAAPALAYSAPAAVAVHAAPVAVHAAHPVVAAPVVVAHEGTYVAKTRGSEHVAPLPGHLNSAASINLQPAPGTL